MSGVVFVMRRDGEEVLRVFPTKGADEILYPVMPHVSALLPAEREQSLLPSFFSFPCHWTDICASTYRVVSRAWVREWIGKPAGESGLWLARGGPPVTPPMASPTRCFPLFPRLLRIQRGGDADIRRVRGTEDGRLSCPSSPWAFPGEGDGVIVLYSTKATGQHGPRPRRHIQKDVRALDAFAHPAKRRIQNATRIGLTRLAAD